MKNNNNANCVWKEGQDDMGEETIFTYCGYVFPLVLLSMLFTYCPYCGKKIKRDDTSASVYLTL